MMEIFVSTLPGISLSCAFFLLLIGFVQGRIYFLRGYERSRSIMIFCLLSVFECINHFIAHSRVFSPEVTLLSVYLTMPVTFVLPIFYMKSVSYFIAVSNRFYFVYTRIFALLSFTTFGCLIYYLATGNDIYYDIDNLLVSGNYFADSYTARFGRAQYPLTVHLALGSFVILVGALLLLRTVLRSSKDWYFVCGLVFTIFCEIRENLLLPFTVNHYVPFVFMANLFEAFRMNSFSYREYMREKHLKDQAVTPEVEKYQNSNLSDERIRALALKISQVLKNEKLYINPNLNSDDLAKKIGIPTYQLSQVVNIGLKTTFFELLSQCRIEEVKRKLGDDDYKEETIINIAYSSGFNSKSAFNTAFKRQTGVTPSVFRKRGRET